MCTEEPWASVWMSRWLGDNAWPITDFLEFGKELQAFAENKYELDIGMGILSLDSFLQIIWKDYNSLIIYFTLNVKQPQQWIGSRW